MLLLVAALLAAPTPDGPSATTAITHVTVIDATGGPPLADRVVLIFGDRIAAVGDSSQVRVPASAVRIDGRGKFLIPGLWDMHVHLSDAGEAAFPLLVANGVVGVRDMGGDLDQLDHWRAEIARGARLGPEIVRAGPFVDGPRPGAPHRVTVTTAAEARRAVDSLQARGVDFIKVHNALPREAFFAVAAEARRLGLPLAVHLPRGISAAEASDSGARSLEHIETLIESAAYRPGATAKTWDEALAENQGARGDALWARFVRNGTWYVPTLVAYFRGFALWGADTAKVAKRRIAFEKLVDLTREMHRAGVPMMTGSDCTEPVVGLVPGADLHQELAFLVWAGFTPLDAIQAATVAPARYLGRERDQGTITPGKRADLLLLDADPLENINNTRTIDTVILRGRVIAVARSRRASGAAGVGKLVEPPNDVAPAGPIETPRKARRNLGAASATWPRAYTLQQYMAIKRANDPHFSPDAGRFAFSSNASGDWQLWVTPTSRWQPRQLTHFSGGVMGRWSPKDKTILADVDRNGDQKYQLVTLDADGGDSTQVTREPAVQHRLGGWMPDGNSIFYTSNARDPRYFDCYVMDLGTRHAERVSSVAGILHAVAASHDGHLLAAEDVHTDVDSDILLIDVQTKTSRVITAHQGAARFSVIGFSGDDRTIYCRTNAGSEYLGIQSIDVANGARRVLVLVAHDIDYAILNRQGTQIAFSENIDGFERLSLWDLYARQRLPLPALPQGINTPQEFSSDGSRLAIVVSTPAHDDEVWVIDARLHHAARVTFSPQGGVAEDSYVLPRAIRYRTFDGRSIPALLFVPPGPSANRRAPVVVSLHGGPEEQEQPYLTNYYQFLVARGYAVLAPNVRGSTGYGKSYVGLDNGPLRWNALKDVAWAVRWIRRQPDLDADKVACFGASYGGFATLAMLVHYPKLFRAGVDFYGPADLTTFLSRTAAYRRPQRIAEYGDPVRDSTFMARISPARHADRIERPLLVVQGATDPIVPPAESEDIVRLIKGHGGVAEYLVFPDEGHGLMKEQNYVKAFETMLEFLRRYMPPPADSSRAASHARPDARAPRASSRAISRRTSRQG